MRIRREELQRCHSTKKVQKDMGKRDHFLIGQGKRKKRKDLGENKTTQRNKVPSFQTATISPAKTEEKERVFCNEEKRARR